MITCEAGIKSRCGTCPRECPRDLEGDVDDAGRTGVTAVLSRAFCASDGGMRPLQKQWGDGAFRGCCPAPARALVAHLGFWCGLRRSAAPDGVGSVLFSALWCRYLGRGAPRGEMLLCLTPCVPAGQCLEDRLPPWKVGQVLMLRAPHQGPGRRQGTERVSRWTRPSLLSLADQTWTIAPKIASS